MFGRRRRREEAARQQRLAARRWQRDCYWWSQLHPGVPVMEAEITREGSIVQWNGPRP